ncbi:hypothetical protein AB1Y20_004661 [Prymnesium parvum]|uniref:SET domain-containing protein n=1 Tax=Prymnesium parvum TaxID=97485 RepID=A0AB34IXM6_PRYPA
MLLTHTSGGRSYVATRAYAPRDEILSAPMTLHAPVWPCDPALLSPTERLVLASPPPPPPAPAAPHDEAAAALRACAASLLSYRALAVRAALRLAAEPLALVSLDDGWAHRPAAARAYLAATAARLGEALGEAAVEVRTPLLEHCLGAILINAFGEARREGGGEAERVGLCLAAAMVQHSCAPNCEAVVRDAAVSIVATQPISEGSELTISYIDASEPTYSRQRLLWTGKLFRCRCVRCDDPTDGERFGGCFRCEACGRGWQRWTARDGWACAACGGSASEAAVWRWDEARRAELAALEERAADEGPSEAVREEYDGLIGTMLEACHPNHKLLLDARLSKVVHATEAHPSTRAAAESKRLAAHAALTQAARVLPTFDWQKADLHFHLGAASFAIAAAETAADAKKEALDAAAKQLLLSVIQFEAVLGQEAPPTRAARDFAALAMRSLQTLLTQPAP